MMPTLIILIIQTNIGWVRYYQRDYTGAISDYQNVLHADPKFIPAQNKLWIAYALQGEPQNADSELNLLFRSYQHPGLAKEISASDTAESSSVVAT